MDSRITSGLTKPVSHALDSTELVPTTDVGPIAASVFHDAGRRSRDPSPEGLTPRHTSASPQGLQPRAELPAWPHTSGASPSTHTPESSVHLAPMSIFGGTVGMEVPVDTSGLWGSQPKVSLEPRPSLDPASDRTHFVWVGKPVAPAELTEAMHMAARGGEVNLWTDQPAKAMKTALSMTSPAAGSIDTSVKLLPAGQGTADSATRQVRLRHVDEAFAAKGDDAIAKRLDLLQASEGVGLGNPGARSDIVRYQVLHQEGGVYMDFDRAEQLRRQTERNVPTTGPFPDIGGEVPLPPGGLKLAHSGHARFGLNNDLLVSAPGSRGSDALRQATASGFGALGQTPALVATPRTLAAHADELRHLSADVVPFSARQANSDIANSVDASRTGSVLQAHPPAWSATRPNVLDQARSPAMRGTPMWAVPNETVMQASGPGAAQRAAGTEGWKEYDHKGLTLSYPPDLAARYGVDRIGLPPSAGSWKRSAAQALPTSFEAPENETP
jgi:hypothetical protein